jgi:hypothetical protein
VEWQNVLQTRPHSAVVQCYLERREQWEYGHFPAFIVWFCGVALMTLPIIGDTLPKSSEKDQPNSESSFGFCY